MGAMLGSMAGLVTVVDQHGTPAMGASSLMRFLAEAAWLPTALLAVDGIHWSAVNDSTATITVTDAGITVSLDVHFRSNGSIERISALRGRDVKGTSVLTPWEGTFSEQLMVVDGMKIPVSAEVSWLLPEGRHSYWRGSIVAASYDYQE